MTLLRGLIIAILALVLLEIAAFAIIAAAIGPGLGLLFLAALSACGALVIRYGGTARTARLRIATGRSWLAMLDIGNLRGRILVAGFLLLVPGFITGVLGIVVLAASLPHAFGAGRSRNFVANDNVVDLAPEDWRHVGDTGDPRRGDRNGKNPG